MAEKHFYEQQRFTKSYLVPYFEKNLPNFSEMEILEIGCAEGGFLDILQEMGIKASGIELEEQRIKVALKKNPNLNIIQGDITDKRITGKVRRIFPLIVMRDVIEHIPDRRAAFTNIRKMLANGGYLYITFPPRFSAFAGHQQNFRSLLRFVPYIHLFPKILIRLLGKIFNEYPRIIESVILNYKIGLSIRKFEKYCREFGFIPNRKDLFLLRPVYQVRFNTKPIRIPNIPLLRESLALGCEYLLQKSSEIRELSE